MVHFIFSYNGNDTIIKCKEDIKMENVLSKLYSINKEIIPSNIYLIYNGGIISDYDLTFNELANSNDKVRKEMNILIYELNRSTIIEDENSIIKFKEIICPQCHENCRISFKDYSINLYDCKNGHETNNIPFERFEDTQKVDESKIICNLCSRNKLTNRQFYFCLPCKQNICSLCKVRHNQAHTIIDYENRFYICEKHNFPYNSFSCDSKINLCIKCEKEHSFKKVIYYKNILPNIINIERNIENFKESIIELISKIKNFEIILNKTKKNVKIFYDIISQIHQNYNSKKINYQNLKNLNEISNNMTILNDLNKIIRNENIVNSFENILNIYNKILNNESAHELREKFLSDQLEKEEKHIFYEFTINGNLNGFRECLEGIYGKKYNIFEEISQKGYYWTPLHYAMHYGKWNIIKFIIEYLNSKNLIEVGFKLKSKGNRCPLLCLLNSDDIKSDEKRDIFEKLIMNLTIPVSDEVKKELKKKDFADLLNKVK